MADSPYKIAPGHNNEAGLLSINTITDANGVRLAPPRCVATEGQETEGPNGTQRFRGYPACSLLLPLLNAQLTLIKTTYSGPVTVRTSLDGGDTFANYNAISKLGDRAALDGQRIDAAKLLGNDVGPDFAGITFWNTEWLITRLEAL